MSSPTTNALRGGAAACGTAAPGSIKTIGDLIDALMTVSLADVLAQNPADAPFLFQKAGFILATARLLPGLEGITEVSGKNSNKGFAKITDFIRDFLTIKIRDGNADGKSDCTFRVGTRPFITSAKFREGGGVDIEKDLGALGTLRASLPEFKDASSVMFVRNREPWIAAYERAHTKEMFPIDHAHVYDVAMFDTAVLSLRSIVGRYPTVEDFATRYLPLAKTMLTPTFHQHLGEILYVLGSVFLFAMKCRAGKTVSAAYNVLCRGFRTVLYITPVPSETKNSAIDTFRRYIEFDGYDVINLEAGVTIASPLTRPTIFVTSKQYLDKHFNDDDIASVHFDAVYQDEIHWAGLTDINGRVRRAVVRDDTSLIVMSGTGEKARLELGIDDSHTFYWNLEDEAACKRGDLGYLSDRFGAENVATSLRRSYGEGVDYSVALKRAYAPMPRLRQLITKLKPEFLANFKMYAGNDAYSFDMKELFRMKDGALVDELAVTRLFKSHLGSSDGSVMRSNMDIIRALGGRAGNVGEKHYPGGGGATQLWFLPEQVAGGTLDSLSGAVKSILDEHFLEYRVIKVNSSAKMDTREGMEKFIAEQEAIAIQFKKEGLIVLLGRMCAMGVSLPRADIVCMFNNLSKIDLYTQEVMRCLTQDVGKKEGIVIDYNQKRVLEASMSLVPRCAGTGAEIIDRMTKVVSFGSNSFETGDITDIVAHFNTIWTAHSFDKINVFRTRLVNSISSLKVTAEEQTEIMKSSWIRHTIGSVRDTQPLLGEGERIPDAVPESGVPSPVDVESLDEDPETLEDIVPNFIHEMLSTIPFFVAFLTYGHKQETLIATLLTKIRDDATLSHIFREQCASWWKGTRNINFIELLINVFGRCDSKDSRDISSTMAALKTEMNALIDDMYATLDLLNGILEPKESEKKEYGEVFTPAWFAEDMLSTLAADVWSNPASTFYDPAAGSGVFCVCVFYRLFEGLQDVIPDKVVRKTHILTNMLYMSEIGSKNVAILRHIFGPLANINHGDSLAFDAAKHWKIRMRDVYVIGNPPYNTSRETSTTCSALYHKFIEKYIDECRALLFVIPSRWFAGGNGVDKFRAMMLARKDIRFIHHIEDASTVFGRNVAIEGGINYFLTEQTYDGLCSFNGVPTDLSKFDVLVDSKYTALITKITTGNKSIASLYMGNPYQISSNDKRLVVDSDGDGMSVCYVSRKKGFKKFIPTYCVKKDASEWKVLTAEANGNSKKFGNTFVAPPGTVYSESYRGFRVKSESEARSLVQFLGTKLPNKLLGLRKASQHISGDTCKWIPLPPLDRVWTDEDVNAYYRLTPEEIALVEE